MSESSSYGDRGAGIYDVPRLEVRFADRKSGRRSPEPRTATLRLFIKDQA